MKYFSDKHLNDYNDEIPQKVWAGILSVINRHIVDGSIGFRFPELCQDGNAVCGTNEKNFYDTLKAHIPKCPWPLQPGEAPGLLVVLDLIEFTYKSIARPIQIEYHGFFKHHHLSFDEKIGKTEFRGEINTIFRRNNIPFIINISGTVERIPSETLNTLLENVFNTGDKVLDQLLHESTKKIKDPDLNERRIALEKLWDAWERLKTIESGRDKKSSTKAILDKAATERNYRQILEQEAIDLTEIGNNFRIRHSETGKIELEKESQIDYFFYRAFCLIYTLLKESHRF
jgi:hypothetical protein